MSYRKEQNFSLKNIVVSADTGVDFNKYSEEDLKSLWRDII